MITITEEQKKRAMNIVWNSAGRYDFQPDFKSYAADGRADIYWNCIFGAARRHYDYEQFVPLFRAFGQYEDEETYDGLMWLGLENCVYQRELASRPALTGLRRKYAEGIMLEYADYDDFRLYEALTYAHFSRALGIEPKMNGYDKKLLDELEFSPELNTEEIVSRVNELFTRWFQISTEERRRYEHRHLITPAFKKRGKKKGSGPFRKFGLGIAEHAENAYGGETDGHGNDDIKTKMSAEELRTFMETKYGKSVLSPRDSEKFERSLCTGSHAACHLLLTYGERVDTAKIQNGFEALSRQRESAQIEKNRLSYKANIAQNKTAILKLTGKIQNSVLLHLQPAPIKSNAGKIDSCLAWRAMALNDNRVFVKNEQDDMGSFAVDILLDASTSQKSRQETVSAQGYMIAESLSRCGIPCRVMSFCSMTGYTVLRIFRDYEHPADNKKIFEYVSNGCNRDGLAISAARSLISRSAYEHRLLIVMSDVKPNDVVKIASRTGGEAETYEHEAGITNTAFEVRRARAEGISVVCVFTGEDNDLPAAKLVYGHDFARVQTMSKLADAVGKLIQNQITNI